MPDAFSAPDFLERNEALRAEAFAESRSIVVRIV
jgi:hypothetical protein